MFWPSDGSVVSVKNAPVTSSSPWRRPVIVRVVVTALIRDGHESLANDSAGSVSDESRDGRAIAGWKPLSSTEVACRINAPRKSFDAGSGSEVFGSIGR